MVKSVVALVGERVAAFELGIVCQVFGLDRGDDGLPTNDFTICAAAPGEVPTTSGFTVRVPHGLDRLAEADLVTVPAWPTLDAPVDAAVLDALRAAADRGARLLSICSGVFPLAAAGLLDGRRAATHWQFADLLARGHPRVRVDRDVLYVADGPVLTSAGAAAGIDACLHLVREEHGTRTANELARRMVVPAHREGGQAQFVDLPVPASADDGIAELLDWMAAHLDHPLPVPDLAARALMSPRTFARRFRAATGTTPHRWLLDARLRRAEELLESTDLPVDQVAHRSGFGSADTLRHHLTARRGVAPSAYRHTFRPSPVGGPAVAPREGVGVDEGRPIGCPIACGQAVDVLGTAPGRFRRDSRAPGPDEAARAARVTVHSRSEDEDEVVQATPIGWL